MAPTSSLSSQFSVYDFFVRLVPGVIAVGLFLGGLPANHQLHQIVVQAGITGGLLLLVVSYTAGHLVQAVASPIDTRLAKHCDYALPFEAELKGENDGNEASVRAQFSKRAPEFFGGDFSGGDLFSLTQSYLLNNGIGRVRRFQALYSFFRSLWVLLCIVTVAYGIVSVLTCLNRYSPMWSLPSITGYSLLLAIGTYLAYLRRRKYHEEMAKTMIFDFYTNVLAEE